IKYFALSNQISVEKEMEKNEKSFTALIWCIEEAHRKLTERIREQEKKEMEKAEGVMEQLEKEIQVLKRREAELKELSETKDHLQFLQTFSSRCVLPADGDSLSFTVTADFSSEDLRKEVSGLKKHLEKISQWIIMRRTPSGVHLCSPEPPPWSSKEVALAPLGANWEACNSAKCPVERAPSYLSQTEAQQQCTPNWFLLIVCVVLRPSPVTHSQISSIIFFSLLAEFCPLTVDINTAHRDRRLSEGNKKVTCEGTDTEYPDHPDRFDYWGQVLCREDLTGTRCYWEVECSGHLMRIGVAYKGLSRKGMTGTGVFSAVCHNDKHTVISIPYSPRVGVYLDWPAGSLTFYRVSHTMTLLHSFNTSFTEPLYPGFGFGLHSSVTISHLTPCDH
ncbi:STXB protein, partial [Polypterus senegalus]|nr:STXB protein [Polypterus senegalus]